MSLTKEEISLYSRQLVIPQFGPQSQINLKYSKVLVIGAGGLGSPVLLYLAAAGVGTLAICDHDKVELSNLQRQVIHAQQNIGLSKVESAKLRVLSIQPLCEVVCYDLILDCDSAFDIIKLYDVIVDATDNAATRYLINDACVILKKPLVSASALKLDGQLTVYNYKGGPCYRCLFSIPPPPESVTNCSDGGILGAVTGVMGTLQALEVIKIISGIGPSYSQKLYLFDALSGISRIIKLRPRQKDCVVCGDTPKIKTLTDVDYIQFCGSGPNDKPRQVFVEGIQRVDCKEYALKRKEEHLLIDVREEIEVAICALQGAVNFPWREFEGVVEVVVARILERPEVPVYCICRRGNDSQFAIKVLMDRINDPSIKMFDIIGGLDAWAVEVDPLFPRY